MSTKTVLLLLGIIVGTVGISNASQITLDPSSLPSSQGWDYSPSGLHAGTVETDIFSTDGSVLNMNSMGQSINWLTGGSILYRQSNVVSSALPTVLEWTSRTLEYEYVACAGQNFGSMAGFASGIFQYGVGIRLDQISLIDGAEQKYISMDTTEYHTYRIETGEGASTYDFYIDNVLEASASARSVTGANYLSFGDGTGGANARVDITALEFSQIPEPATMSAVT